MTNPNEKKDSCQHSVEVLKQSDLGGYYNAECTTCGNSRPELKPSWDENK